MQREDYDGKAQVRHERELREAWVDAHEQLHESEREAVNMARNELARRLDEMNELRKQIEAERGMYVRRDMYDREYDSLRERLEGQMREGEKSIDLRLKILENIRANVEGRLWAIGAVLSVLVIGMELLLRIYGK